jgi:hypothetical protein
MQIFFVAKATIADFIGSILALTLGQRKSITLVNDFY